MAPIRIPSGTYTSSASAGASTAPPSSGWDYILKFILIGDSSVGKSSLLVRLTDDRFLADPDPTIGVEFGSHLIRLDNGETVKVQVWDTAGSESFRSITRSYYRGAAGALLVYDITHRASFLNVKGWLDDVRSHAEEKVSVVLVGNMYDLVEDEDETSAGKTRSSGEGGEDAGEEEARRARTDRRRSKGKKREVSYQEAKEFAEQEGLLFLEASAKSGHVSCQPLGPLLSFLSSLGPPTDLLWKLLSSDDDRTCKKHLHKQRETSTPSFPPPNWPLTLRVAMVVVVVQARASMTMPLWASVHGCVLGQAAERRARSTSIRPQRLEQHQHQHRRETSAAFPFAVSLVVVPLQQKHNQATHHLLLKEALANAVSFVDFFAQSRPVKHPHPSDTWNHATL